MIGEEAAECQLVAGSSVGVRSRRYSASNQREIMAGKAALRISSVYANFLSPHFAIRQKDNQIGVSTPLCCMPTGCRHLDAGLSRSAALANGGAENERAGVAWRALA
jgi:hypothetical protein